MLDHLRSAQGSQETQAHVIRQSIQTMDPNDQAVTSKEELMADVSRFNEELLELGVEALQPRGEHVGDTGRYREIHGDTGRYWGVRGDTGRYGEIQGDTGR